MAHSVLVVGLGRVGLPLALVLAERGDHVVGIDSDAGRLKAIRDRRMPFRDEGCDDLLRRHLNRGFRALGSAAEVAEPPGVIVLTLGTPVDEHLNPIFAQVEKAFAEMAPLVRRGALVLLRSTVAPGSMEYFADHLAGLTGLKVGESIFLAYCPERIASGRSLQEIREIPQIVGADDESSRSRAADFFAGLAPGVLTSDARSAELAKLFCNMYRYVNFALGNEFMMIASQFGCRIAEVRRLVNTDYKRGGLASPGLTGGPCLFKDGFFLLSRTPFNELVATAWKINEAVPAYLIEAVKTLVPLRRAKVALLGLAFKKEIDDTRNSLAFKVRKLLRAERAEVVSHDPYLPGAGIEEALRGADVVFVATNHGAFREAGLELLRGLAKPGAVVCDPWDLYETGRVVFRLAETGGAPADGGPTS